MEAGRQRKVDLHICLAQDVQQEKQETPIDRKDIAQALHKRNIFRQTEPIQISPNGRFCSIKFQKKEIMQTFCAERLTISENNTIYFKPDYKPRQHRSYTFISFLYVPLETQEKKIGVYVRQNCSIHGLHYSYQKTDDITYKTGTRVYRVSNINEHFPKTERIFGRWVRIMYDNQSEPRKETTDDADENQDEIETQHEQPPTIQDSPVIEETPPLQIPKPLAAIQPTITD